MFIKEIVLYRFTATPFARREQKEHNEIFQIRLRCHIFARAKMVVPFGGHTCWFFSPPVVRKQNRFFFLARCACRIDLIVCRSWVSTHHARSTRKKILDRFPRRLDWFCFDLAVFTFSTTTTVLEPYTTTAMTDLKASKDTLVASLFELSKAAQEAANATVNFYKAVEETGASGTVDPVITTLTSSLLASLATTLQQFTTNATKPPPKPRSRKRAHPENEETVKVTSEVTESAPVAPAAPVATPVDKSSISSDSSTTMSTTTANTEAKPAPKARKPRAKKVVVAEAATEETPSLPPTSDEKPVAEDEAEPEAKPKKKRVKRERDPNEPKKPLTIFFKYSIALREKLRQERQKQGLPNLSAIEVNDFITKEWEAVEPLVKAQMQKEYADEMKGYHVRKEEYVATKAATETAEAAAAAAAATENNPEYDVIVQEPGEEPRVETDVAKELPDSTVATDIEEVEVPTKEKKNKEKAKEKKKKTEKTEKKKKTEKSEKKKKTEK